VVTLHNTVKNGQVKSPTGGSLNISGQYISQDTFARRNGQWQLVAAASVQIKAPTAAPSPTPKASPSPGASPAVKATPSPKATPRATPAAKTSPAPKPAATPIKKVP
jgi:hypothetical protein